jgi:hypothetical protein
MTSPVRSRTRSSSPCADSAAQRAAVRLSCQTMARPPGRPDPRSQTTTVSRWLVMPSARTASGVSPASLSASAATAIVTRRISSGSCSTQPGLG